MTTFKCENCGMRGIDHGAGCVMISCSTLELAHITGLLNVNVVSYVILSCGSSERAAKYLGILQTEGQVKNYVTRQIEDKIQITRKSR